MRLKVGFFNDGSGDGGGEGTLLPKSPSCAAGDIGWSRRFDAGFCAEGREIRSCHFGIGRFCCHHERRVCPAHRNQINDKYFVSIKENWDAFAAEERQIVCAN